MDISRRRLIEFGAGVVGTASLATVLGLNLNEPEPVSAQNGITPDQALEKLMAGNKRFIQGKPLSPNRSSARLREVAQGQNPFAAILSCADSRVPSEIVFDQGFGDLFIVRNAGQVATPEEIGSLEFGTLVLGAKVLLVMGHESCGAVIATMAGNPVPGKIGSVLEQIEPGITEFKGKQDDPIAVKQATEANVLAQIANLKKSPVISELIESGKLKIVGGFYNLKEGSITLLT
ncbi:carbonic anhydrase [Rippkaea orientalis PCC 8801]|uniref:carbonic anhydrase n=1 Tax=Rippkaea orientalis (strain PCC 8801 / RF-1) TaxID=41431 RepID=B7K6B9_RIPO1|nr:carbonic anhydrase [Rippkaea orientalis]ACK68172.1 carbonic anhydrase [Rippkaea orientalis PCC 8801]